ncbi:TMV resistance protein N-like [Quercus robur]|uniref:TMV resistance protein N-like n=1 Tax=Quercus robur TaxID=38942 RepID=UPI0021628FE0|nr:TMV resistance protein N-like [Quercus robur]XP_050257546.1 TMV resistance protein N-like [Quercus robur]XP_050257547.1 TMV resistance protein N-like [Quercus robur]XP_050257548.1 TMV resistance protein N-like [Quercus robur]XP_050257549.1 TMV resistance protein N-like [Quercus robur]XP_050257550.1 TMV resistance protein N-like [Quercus robur]XP_050257551.1 TMV resistance protein N-like [Quercus robur]XP_050257553.1 TMV resistance protein N-like [Quercus robur]
METQIASSSSSPPYWKYDVYLNFRGEDTRNGFTSHLYHALNQKGIFTFVDDILRRGKTILAELLKVIEGSKFAIVVLSTNYASSTWCLNELVKIVECMKQNKLTILPVFYHVNPSDARNQMGILARRNRTFAEAFAEHERNHVNIKDLQAWKAALKEVGNISGWHVQQHCSEADVIQEIVQRVLGELNLILSRTISKDLKLVGIESRVREVLDLYVDERPGGVRFVGICGMGGIGKTTLAVEIFKRISGSFEASSYIADVREKTENQHLVSLQKQLLSNIFMESEIKIWNVHEGINIIGNRLRGKKVLIVLDDVEDQKQLEALAGNLDWFGPGSRIIVTSRDSQLLKRCGVNYIYAAKGLNPDEALQLLSLSAFKKPHPKENYVDLCRYFVNYTKGLPLALKVLGSLLFTKSTDEWESLIDKLKAEPEKKILDILQISFDGLMETQKELFLDIACFFKGENKDCIREILKSFGYYPDYNIGVLMDKSLLTINENGALWMHDLLQEMGQDIVRRGSKEPGRRTRLWLYEDVLHVLKNNTGTEVVEGIMLNAPIQKEEHLDAEVFSKMKKMRLLKVGDMGNVKLPQGLNCLSNELRIIEWHGYPLSFMPTNFQPNKLVELKMHCSSIKRLWDGIMILDELKLIDLRNSQNLIETPNLSGVPNLKQLILQGCTALSKIDPSLGNLKQLIRLDLSGCKCLESLPHKINLESLEVIILSGCSRLKKFPEVVGNMPCLSELYLNETAIKDLPLSVKHLTGLIKLDLTDCKNLSSLPNACYSSMSLKILTLSGCSKLEELPENLGNLKDLEELDLSGSAIKVLPTSIKLLKNLKELSLHGCKGLSFKSSNKLFSFPFMQQRSPDPMVMLECSLSGLWSLTKLDLSHCNLQAIPNAFDCLSSLLILNLEGNEFIWLPKSMIQLSNLQDLFLCGCSNLRSLPKLPSNIKYIDASQCTSLETLSSGSEYDFRPALQLLNCVKLIENQGYGYMSTMLRRYFINDKHYYGQDRLAHYIYVPGGEIPKWFRHQNVGASMSLQMPSDFCNKLMGIAMCIVFVFRQHRPFKSFDQLDFEGLGHNKYTHKLSCSIKFNYCEIFGVADGFSEEFGKIERYHLWLQYIPSQFFHKDWEKASSKSNANGFDDIEIEFKTWGPGLEVTKCGAHLVFKQDVEDLKQTMVGSSSCSITPYEDDFDCSARDTMIKGSHDDYDGEGAEPSGEGTSNDVDAPHPKWIQQPNLIENWIENFNSCTQ